MHFEPVIGGSVLEQVAAPLLGRGFSILRAQTVAYRFLRRADVADCAPLSAAELDCFETLRVAVARALVTAPSLLLVDQSSSGDSCEQTNRGLDKLLCSIAHHALERHAGGELRPRITGRSGDPYAAACVTSGRRERL